MLAGLYTAPPPIAVFQIEFGAKGCRNRSLQAAGAGAAAAALARPRRISRRPSMLRGGRVARAGGKLSWRDAVSQHTHMHTEEVLADTAVLYY